MLEGDWAFEWMSKRCPLSCTTHVAQLIDDLFLVVARVLPYKLISYWDYRGMWAYSNHIRKTRSKNLPDMPEHVGSLTWTPQNGEYLALQWQGPSPRPINRHLICALRTDRQWGPNCLWVFSLAQSLLLMWLAQQQSAHLNPDCSCLNLALPFAGGGGGEGKCSPWAGEI